MDALLPPFLAAFIAEWGDKTQMLTMLLAMRFRQSPRVLIGIGLAALLNSLAAAFAGSLIAPFINFRAMTLMLALALFSAAISALLPQKLPKLAGRSETHVVLASFFAFAVLEFGDKTQFITLTLAARAGSIWLAGFGAGAGILLANVPAVILADRLPQIIGLRATRIGAGILFLVTGLIAAIEALELL